MHTTTRKYAMQHVYCTLVLCIVYYASNTTISIIVYL